MRMSPSIECLDGLGKLDNPVDPRILESSCMNNYVILRRVFQKVWDVEDLKDCRLVCRSWNDIARPVLLTRTILPLPNDLCDLSGYSNVLLGSHTPSTGVRIPMLLNPLDVSNIINECKEFVKYLKLDCPIRDGDCPSLDSFPDLVLPRLRTLVLTKFLDTWKPERTELQSLFLVDLIRRAPNVRELVISHPDLPRAFFVSLLPSLKTCLNFRVNLQVLRFTNPLENSELNNGDIETLRGMKLRLRTLEMTFPDRNLEPFPSMVGWILDMRLTLRYLELKTFRRNPTNKIPVFVLGFVLEMPVLRTLIVHEGELFGLTSVFSLLHNLPVLERLHLSAVPNSVLNREQFLHETTQHTRSYPLIRDLLIQTESRELSNLPLSQFIPRLFPNLRKVRLNIYSGTELQSLVEMLKGSRILETLHVILCKDEDPELRETQVHSTALASSVPWKALQSLTIEYQGWLSFGMGFSLEESPYRGLSLLSLITQMKGLTCLRLKNVGRIRLDNVKDLVGEFPLLRSLVLSDWSTVHLKGVGRDDPELTCREVKVILQAEMLKVGGSSWPGYFCLVKEQSSDNGGVFSRKSQRRIFH